MGFRIERGVILCGRKVEGAVGIVGFAEPQVIKPARSVWEAAGVNISDSSGSQVIEPIPLSLSIMSTELLPTSGTE
jgi:hypothetical protein